ncbi:hypothetical protein CI109_105706 [Kwoniella shandongensis]|uniref:Uncharacterized protein n=1 Tax=Kwoniella shandongensis TaxID=1734106 RepID=A0A5M6C0J5_9TREE|nr:uncharacterized protein CI109_003046 [Kwoniella shandongensis]KAA5528514.1 hypothetical protein CI109_003046 [Kwoniella shandongensis]
MAASAVAELNKVRLEPEGKKKNRDKGKGKGPVREKDDSSDEDDDSDLESSPTDEDPDLEISYEVDAIKWAKYRDSRRDRQDGYIGWHYGVMWKGYLKTSSETEEPLSAFEVEEGGTPLIDEFWKAVGKPLRKGQKEPKGVLGEVVETPKATMKNWLKQCRPRRDYATFVRRRAKELEREKRERQGLRYDDLLITKVDSDYYWNRKRKRDIRKRKAAAAAGENPASIRPTARAGSSTRRTTTPAPAPAPARRRSATPPTAQRTAQIPVALGSPASTLGSVFNSDDEHVSLDLDAVSEEEQEEVELPTAGQSEKGKGTKRKHQITSSPMQDSSNNGQSNSTSFSETKKTKKAKTDKITTKDIVSSGATSRLAGIGKIPKRTIPSPPPTDAPDVTFGQLQPGIFDPAPSPAPFATVAVASITGPASASGSPSVSLSLRAEILARETASPISQSDIQAAQIASAALEKDAIAVDQTSNAPAPRDPRASIPPLNAASAASIPSRDPRLAIKATDGNVDQTPANATVPPTPVSAPLPPPGPPPPPPPPLSLASPNPSSASVPVDPRVQKAQLPARPIGSLTDPRLASNARRPPSPPSTSGPVPSFRPAPISQAQRQAPPPVNRPKYVQPSRIQIAPSAVDPEVAKRLARVGIKDNHIVPQPPAGPPQAAYQAGFPVQPKSSAFVPRQQQPHLQPELPGRPNGPPLGPRADRMPDNSQLYGRKAPGPLPEQKAIFRTDIAPRQRQQQLHGDTSGSLSPNAWGVGPSGNMSPNANATQFPPMNGHMSPQIGIASPPMPSAPVIPQSLPRDPRLRLQQTSASASPTNANAALPTPTSATTPLPSHLATISKPVESQGGLVTFSPSLILRNPEALAQIMTVIQSSNSWGAYVIPSVIELAGKSWPNAQLCPDPTYAYSVLHQFLNLDNRLRQFSNSAITSGGGLTVTCCPPSPYNAAACANWKVWVDKISAESEYTELTKLCAGIVPGFFEKQAQAQKNGNAMATAINALLTMRDVENAQVEDMRAMRIRKDVADYTRFVYVGDEELSAERKAAIGEEIEFLTTDQFLMILNTT